MRVLCVCCVCVLFVYVLVCECVQVWTACFINDMTPPISGRVLLVPLGQWDPQVPQGQEEEKAPLENR